MVKNLSYIYCLLPFIASHTQATMHSDDDVLFVIRFADHQSSPYAFFHKKDKNIDIKEVALKAIQHIHKANHHFEFISKRK